jgi:uncharacterized protein (UPF0548 family)
VWLLLSLRRPSIGTIRDFLAAQSKLGFTYSAIGDTANVPPAGYALDHARIRLGEGEEVFSRARSALERWLQFRLGWVEAYPPKTPIRAGEVVAVIARAAGLWSVNACRIIYIIDEPAPIRRFGFAYGTLADHMASGEERFLVEWDRETGEVWYDVLAFSRPRQFLSRLGYRYMRRVQERFRKESGAAMVKAAEIKAQ